MRSTLRTTILTALPVLVVPTFLISCSKKPEAVVQAQTVPAGANIRTAALSPVADYYDASGTVQSKTSCLLSSRITGAIVAIRTHEGDRVRAGQGLVEIDDRDARASISRAKAAVHEAGDAFDESAKSIEAAEAARTAAEANRSLANATFIRFKALLDRKSASPQEFDEAHARFAAASAEADRASALVATLRASRNRTMARMDEAEAGLDDAKIAATYSTIASPINGVVTSKRVEVGATATPGAPLLTVEDSAVYRLEAIVEDSHLGSIRLGDAVGVDIDALGTGEIPGKVSEIVPASDPASHSSIVKIALTFSGADSGFAARLRSGLFGRARFKLGERRILAIPASAIIRQGELTGVFVIEGESVHLRLVKCGKTYGDDIEVLSGLNEGERFAANGATIQSSRAN